MRQRHHSIGVADVYWWRGECGCRPSQKIRKNVEECSAKCRQNAVFLSRCVHAKILFPSKCTFIYLHHRFFQEDMALAQGAKRGRESHPSIVVTLEGHYSLGKEVLEPQYCFRPTPHCSNQLTLAIRSISWMA